MPHHAVKKAVQMSAKKITARGAQIIWIRELHDESYSNCLSTQILLLAPPSEAF